MLSLFTDGGARGNPGPSAFGVVIKNNQEVVASFGKTIGIATNNVAEYSGVIAAFEYLLSHPILLRENTSATLFLDSQLICMQLKGLYRVKHQGLIPLFLRAKDLEKKLGLKISYTHIPREQNKLADRQVNLALDK